MAATSTSDVVILGLGVVLAALYLFKDQLFSQSKASNVPSAPVKGLANGGGNPRDFIAKMKESVSDRLSLFHLILRLISNPYLC